MDIAEILALVLAAAAKIVKAINKKPGEK